MKLVLAASCSVGDYIPPVGELVGYGGMESISRMTNAVAMFLDSINCIKLLTVVDWLILFSHHPAQPFIKNEVLEEELSSLL